MKPPLWKKLLSYFIELHQESTSSEYNPHLYVSLRRGRYQLCTANAVYSYEDLYDNFSRAFNRLDLDQLPGKKVLILGLGLGSIPLILERLQKRSFNYTAVEIDEEVIYLAHKYILTHLHSPMEIITANALAFIAQCQDTFDLITMDIFLDDTIPESFESMDFLMKLKQMTNPGGLIMYNRLANKKEDIQKTTRFFNGPFKQVFPHSSYLEVSGNRMLINHPGYIK